MTITTSIPIAELKEQFIRVGYCIVPGLFTETELQEIEAFFEEYKHVGGKAFDAGSAYEEIDLTKRQVRAMHPHRYSEKAKAWLLNPQVAKMLEILLGRPPLAAQSMYYLKPPGGKGQGMHQDNFYLLAEPATCITAWTAIDESTVENGCLWVVPGSHLGDIYCPDRKRRSLVDELWRLPHQKIPTESKTDTGGGFTWFNHVLWRQFDSRLWPESHARCFRRTFIGHYVDEASEQVAQFYHPVLNMRGEVSRLAVPVGGGPCGDGWLGATH